MEDELTGFYDITTHFLTELGYEMDICTTEAEAKEKAGDIDKTNKYPVYVFNSDTTGEKLYEEFSTENEVVDWDRYESLAVAKAGKEEGGGNSSIVIKELKETFKSDNILKTDIVHILKRHIPTFGHIEKGVTLDNKM